MECRRFHVTLISASGLLSVRRIFKMKVYPKVSIDGCPDSEWTGDPDYENKTNPHWNYTVQYSIPKEAVQEEGYNLVINLYCQRWPKADKYVGELSLSLKQLFDGGLARRNIHYSVSRNNAPGQTFGTLELSYSFGSNTTVQGYFNSLIGGSGPSSGRSGPSRRRSGHGSGFSAADGGLLVGAAYEGLGEEEEEEEEEG